MVDQPFKEGGRGRGRGNSKYKVTYRLLFCLGLRGLRTIESLDLTRNFSIDIFAVRETKRAGDGLHDDSKRAPLLRFQLVLVLLNGLFHFLADLFRSNYSSYS